jgi:hypothetical protein
MERKQMIKTSNKIETLREKEHRGIQLLKMLTITL